MSRRAIFCENEPPELDSLIVPVSGLFAPTDMRPELGADVPLRSPGAKIILLFLPRAWQVGLTSSLTKLEVSARPPSRAYSSGTAPTFTFKVVMSTRINLLIKNTSCRFGCVIKSRPHFDLRTWFHTKREPNPFQITGGGTVSHSTHRVVFLV